jgi:hypothetical protein
MRELSGEVVLLVTISLSPPGGDSENRRAGLGEHVAQFPPPQRGENGYLDCTEPRKSEGESDGLDPRRQLPHNTLSRTHPMLPKPLSEMCGSISKLRKRRLGSVFGYGEYGPGASISPFNGELPERQGTHVRTNHVVHLGRAR